MCPVVSPVVLSAMNVLHLVILIFPGTLDPVHHPVVKVVFVLDDGATALAVGIVS